MGPWPRLLCGLVPRRGAASGGRVGELCTTAGGHIGGPRRVGAWGRRVGGPRGRVGEVGASGSGRGGGGVCIGARRGLASGGSGGSTSRGLGTGAKIVCCCSLGRAIFFSRGLARPHLESSVCCGMGRCFVCPLALNAPMTPAGRAKGRPQDSLGGMANPSRKCLR